MTAILKTAATLLAASLVAGTAAAAGPTATFVYDPAQPAGEMYASFEKQVRKACRSDAKSLLIKSREETACRSDMLDQLVSKAGCKEIAALHRESTGEAEPARQLASAT